ncbi:MAG: T9SS type A sorting domain-containing protein [Saprospiraceae bacterium]|nr:T9SS type A sorting domain-containing protein [Saprospiraceae bacterium]
MKKFLLSALVAGAAFTGVDAQVQKVAFFEHFTGMSCGPCANVNPGVEALIDANTSAEVIIMRYQVPVGGPDIIYNQNTADVNQRFSTDYGLNSGPSGRLNGADIGSVGDWEQADINGVNAVMTDIDIELTHEINQALDSVVVTCKVKNLGSTATSTDLDLRVALTERDIIFATAPGSNGEDHFRWVMRDMYPDAGGTDLAAIPAGDSVTITFNEALPNYLYDLREVETVAFVQVGTNGDVLQAAKTTPAMPAGAILADLAATASTTAPTGICDYNFTPAIDLTNSGTQDIDSVVVNYSIDGGTPVTQTYTTAIATGASATVTFPTATLPGGGTSTVSYEVVDMYAGGNTLGDIAPGNNAIADDQFSTASPSAVGTDIEEGFENAVMTGIYSRDVDDVIFVSNGLDLPLFSVAEDPMLGGFGNSDKTILFRFYNIQVGEMDVIFDKRDLSSMSSPELTFAHAHSQYGTENDALDVAVSTDCGATWTSVWNKAGSDLSTVGTNSGGFFPVAGDWVADTVDLAAYASASEVLVRFRGTSAYGNNLFVDDVNLSEAAVSTNVEVAQATTEARIMPNPVSDVMNLEISVSDNTEASIEIYNAIGQRVKSVANTTLSGTNVFTVNTSDLAVGVYNVNIITEEGMTTKRFTVQR